MSSRKHLRVCEIYSNRAKSSSKVLMMQENRCWMWTIDLLFATEPWKLIFFYFFHFFACDAFGFDSNSGANICRGSEACYVLDFDGLVLLRRVWRQAEWERPWQRARRLWSFFFWVPGCREAARHHCLFWLFVTCFQCMNDSTKVSSSTLLRHRIEWAFFRLVSICFFPDKCIIEAIGDLMPKGAAFCKWRPGNELMIIIIWCREHSFILIYIGRHQHSKQVCQYLGFPNCIQICRETVCQNVIQNKNFN